jgi:hypothetical protein
MTPSFYGIFHTLKVATAYSILWQVALSPSIYLLGGIAPQRPNFLLILAAFRILKLLLWAIGVKLIVFPCVIAFSFLSNRSVFILQFLASKFFDVFSVFFQLVIIGIALRSR